VHNETLSRIVGCLCAYNEGSCLEACWSCFSRKRSYKSVNDRDHCNIRNGRIWSFSKCFRCCSVPYWLDK